MVAPATDIRAANAANVERLYSNDIVSFISAARRSPLAARRSPLAARRSPLAARRSPGDLGCPRWWILLLRAARSGRAPGSAHRSERRGHDPLQWTITVAIPSQ
jgi:hypothetical protein